MKESVSSISISAVDWISSPLGVTVQGEITTEHEVDAVLLVGPHVVVMSAEGLVEAISYAEELDVS